MNDFVFGLFFSAVIVSVTEIFYGFHGIGLLLIGLGLITQMLLIKAKK